jgi:hypothetical protein
MRAVVPKEGTVAVAIVQDWIEPETERSTKNYDAVSEVLQGQEPIDGLRVHTAGFTGNGFRIFEVWDSKEQQERFLEDRLMPLLVAQEGSDPTPPPTTTVYELHNFMAV